MPHTQLRWASVVLLALPILLASVNYWLWWQPHFIEVGGKRVLAAILVLYWLTVLAALVVGYLMRHRPWLALASLTVTAAVMWPFATPAVALTGWWFHGIGSVMSVASNNRWRGP